jgi:L-fucose isomerase
LKRDGRPVVKPSWEITAGEVQECLAATTWYPAIIEYFRGGGYSSGFLTRGSMPVTMSRINLIKGLGPVLQLAEGWTVDLPEHVYQALNERTNPTWSTHWFVPRLSGSGAFRDVYSVMANWGANHGALSYGHTGADLVALAAMLRLPVSLHNLPEEQLFRPSAWSAFGALDAQGADYRACAAYGPLYGKYG